MSTIGQSRHVTLWTIQPLPVWKVLQSKGYIQARHVLVEKHFRPAYRWMSGQMRLRLGPSPSSIWFPMWAWYQWQGADKKRPDLRFSGHLPSGKTGVLIEFLAEAAEVLLSDFELWHYVLNYLYLPYSPADETQFDSILASFAANTPSEVASRHRAFHDAVRKSWERIFDIRWSLRDIAATLSQKSIQATLWRLNRDQVKNWTTFRAR